MTALEVLPGGGWDNLRNLDMGRVMDFNYQQCQTTEDGFYFVPDDVFVVPWKRMQVQTYAEVITSWQDHKSSTSFSINIGGSFTGEEGELNGRFSAEHQRVKTNQVKGQSATTRVQVRNHIYTVKANPDFRLDPIFVHQIENIAGAITDNQTGLATYLSEKLVADYGTHVITSVDAGAALVKEDYIKSSYVSSSDSSMTSIKASAGYTFFGLFSIDTEVSFNHNPSDQSAYDSSITSSFMEGYGGSPYYPGMCLGKWQESTRNNLIAIDRSGLPLHYVINTNTLPDLTEPTISRVAASVQQAVQRYYKVNTHPGCVDYNSPHFNFHANVDDGSCDGTGAGHSLGGVYQWFEGDDGLCQDLFQTNPDTNDFTCSPPYKPTLLHTEEIQEHFTEQACSEESYACGFLWLDTCYEEKCVDVFKERSAKVSTYWCYSSGPTEKNWFLLGGFYGGSVKNPVTKGRGCPLYFTAYKFLSNDFTICLSQEYERGALRAVPFGGFFSCSSTNPVTGHKDCPPRFRQHLVSVSHGCTVYYCSIYSVEVSGEQELIIHLPPFTPPPVILRSNSNRTRATTGQSGSVARAATDGIRDGINKTITESAEAFLQKAGIGFGATTAVVILMIVGAVVTCRWKMGLSPCKKQRREGGGVDGAAVMQDLTVRETEEA